MSVESNPYTPLPAALATDAVPGLTEQFFREGDLVWVTRKTVLPARCVKTNQAIVAGDWTGKMSNIIWKPRWTNWLILLGPIPYVIAISVTQKAAKYSYSLCREKRRQEIRRRWIALTLMLASMIPIVLVCQKTPVPPQELGISLAVGLVVFVAAAIYQSRNIPLKVKQYRNDWFALRGCCPEFLATLPEVPAANLPPALP